ncbi:MAG: glycerophosphodiester phosphodiesterase, partial [Actinomycetota bacterium]|nr:glycerophosphodiester phosphodiesterase [Actinomycetota bacterium]
MGAVVDAPPGLNNRVTVIAHRGASADTPENTLPAVDLGADMLADFIEIDVRMTRDAELVAIHDITLART